jgi:hypothetical protein
MSSQRHVAGSEEHELLTVQEATVYLRIGRSLGYQLAHEYLNTGGTSGLPVIRFGEKCYRVPRWALVELASTGRVVRLCRFPRPSARPERCRRHQRRSTLHHWHRHHGRRSCPPHRGGDAGG